MLLLVVAAPLVALAAAGFTWLQIQRRGSEERPRRADAIVVFGAAARNGRPSPELQARLDRAAELHAGGYAPLVLCSGGPSEVGPMRDSLLRAGVPRDAIEIDEAGMSTRHTIAAARRYGRVLVVSSPYHLHRILGEAGRQGVDAAPVPARAPRSIRRRRVRQALREVAAVWWYAASARARRDA
jgi:vancomycin permeability regulator SanA